MWYRTTASAGNSLARAALQSWVDSVGALVLQQLQEYVYNSENAQQLSLRSTHISVSDRRGGGDSRPGQQPIKKPVSVLGLVEVRRGSAKPLNLKIW